MSTKNWTANCFMSSSIGWQEVSVQSNTVQGAKAMIERIYNPEHIHDLREEGFNSGSELNLGCLSFFVMPLILGFVISTFFGAPFFIALAGGVFLYILFK